MTGVSMEIGAGEIVALVGENVGMAATSGSATSGPSGERPSTPAPTSSDRGPGRRAEHELFESIRTLCRGRSVLLISHRFSSVRSADRIYVLQASAYLAPESS